MILENFVAIGLPVSLALIMLSMGLTLSTNDFRSVLGHPRAFIVGLSAQLLLLPLLALLLLQFFELPAELAIGLLILSFCPGGTTSNLFSYLAKADVPLSICLTLAASVITPLSIPLLTEASLHYMLGESREIVIPFGLTASRLIAVTVLPLLIGMLLNHLRTNHAKILHYWAHKLSLLLFFCVIATMILNLGKDLPSLLQQIGSITLIMVILAMLSGRLLSRIFQLRTKASKTITIEVGMQNGGMALIVTQGILHNSSMSLVPITYGLLMLLPIAAYIVFLRDERTQAI